MVYIRRLVWENGPDGNIEHIARHHVTPEEVEEVCHGQFIVGEAYGGRFLIIGPTLSGRMLGIILGPIRRKKGIYYTVTARPAKKKEIQRYDDESR